LVFLPTATMPNRLRAFAEHQPITIIANAIRGLMLGSDTLPAGQTVSGQVLIALLWIGAITLVFSNLAVWQYRRIST